MATEEELIEKNKKSQEELKQIPRIAIMQGVDPVKRAIKNSLSVRLGLTDEEIQEKIDNNLNEVFDLHIEVTMLLEYLKTKDVTEEDAIVRLKNELDTVRAEFKADQPS